MPGKPIYIEKKQLQCFGQSIILIIYLRKKQSKSLP